MAECPREACWPDAGCSLGHVDLSKCPALKEDSAATEDASSTEKVMAMPWSGRALGLTDIGFVAGRVKPRVLAIVGPHNAGKTTLLGAWYLLLGRGARPDEKLRFAGSCSLSGWEVVASALRWEPGPVLPVFPPHTSSRGAWIPGLLHLAFTSNQRHRRDYLVTDAPGEWFQKWAVRRDDPDAEGARWAAEHADAFVLVADCEALAGSTKGAARSGIQLLARRLADELRGRPVAFVWTKSDVSIPEEMREGVRRAVLRVIPEAEEFAVSIVSKANGLANAQGFLHLLGWALKVQRSAVRLSEPVETDNLDPVFRLGMR